MSWSIEVTGSKDGVKAHVEAVLTKIAANYEGKPEADDVRAVKDRILALVDACALGKDAYGTEWNAIKVSASGSHSWTNEGVASATLNLTLCRMCLAL